jgi:peptide chain release factor 1
MKMDKLFDRLQMLADRYEELGELLSDPDVIADSKRFMELSKEMADLRETVEKYEKYKQVVQQIKDDEEMLSAGLDDEMAAMVKEELSDSKNEKQELEQEIKILLLPKDPNDGKDLIMEIRGAAGGDEASLFAADLFSMYSKYAERQGWSIEVIDKNMTEVGGFKEIALTINGKNVWSKLKYESGAHRVQRVPVTESAGRVHTSTATVVVMPEEEDVEIDLDPKDIRVDVYRSSGAGGQHINKTSSAVRMTHLPTGIVVAMQDQRSQQQNREKAMKILKARVYDYYKSQEQSEYDENRKSAVGTGDRSERIRTYNYPQNRVTDHRIGLSLNKLDRIMNGELDDVIDALVLYDQTKALEELQNG